MKKEKYMKERLELNNKILELNKTKKQTMKTIDNLIIS